MPTGAWSNCSGVPFLSRKSAYSFEPIAMKSIARLARMATFGVLSFMTTV